MRSLLAALMLVALGCTTSGSYRMPAPSSGVQERAALLRQVALPTVLVQAQSGRGSGTVFYQDSHMALIVTAAHVILGLDGEPEKVAAMRHDQFSDKVLLADAKPIRWNAHLDLAVLQTKPIWPAAARLVTADDYPDFGLYSKIVAYGHPLGLLDGILTEGRINDLDDDGFMGISAQMTFGNSGCGVFTLVDGRYVLIGVEQRGYVHETGSSITHLCLACRPDTLLKFLKGLPR